MMRDGGVPVNREPYEWKSAAVQVTTTNATTDITGITGFTALFDKIPVAYRVKVSTDGAAYIRLNANDNDKITLGSTTPYETEWGIVRKIFISTNNVSRTITVELA